MVRFVDSGAGATDEDALAPVIPMFGDARGELTAAAREAEPETEDDRVERGMAALLKRLRTRSLSIKESESVLRGLELEDADVAEVIERVLSYGYLDDAALAEQLVHTGTQRKGQGRGVIAQNLAKRGIPRDVADAALDTLPDDDAERALEFARTKARSLAGVERDAALRRLAGQLARRGYGGGVAFSAARTALDELAAPPSRVRFD